MKKKKVRDILVEKNAKLEELTAQATAAVDLVTRTISGLELVNQEIDDTVSEIDIYMVELAKTRDALNKNRTNNRAIVANFAKLLEVPNGDGNAAA